MAFVTANGIRVVSVTQGTTIFFTGVVDENTKVKFAVYNAAGQLVMTHLTAPAASNCVVAHEFAAFWTYHGETDFGAPVLVENAVDNQYVAGITIR